MKVLNEMTIGRTDDPENPTRAMALEAARLFGAGSRIPSGPAAMMPRKKAGHMTAIDPSVGILNLVLASEGPSTHALGAVGVADDTGRIFDVGFEPKPAGVAFQEARDRIRRGGRHSITFEPAPIRGKIVFATQ